MFQRNRVWAGQGESRAGKQTRAGPRAKVNKQFSQTGRSRPALQQRDSAEFTPGGLESSQGERRCPGFTRFRRGKGPQTFAGVESWGPREHPTLAISQFSTSRGLWAAEWALKGGILPLPREQSRLGSIQAKLGTHSHRPHAQYPGQLFPGTPPRRLTPLRTHWEALWSLPSRTPRDGNVNAFYRLED